MHFLFISYLHPLSPLQLSLPSVIRARVLVPIDLRTIASETKMSFYGTDHALFAKVIIPYYIISHHITWFKLFDFFFTVFGTRKSQLIYLTYDFYFFEQKVCLVWSNCSAYLKGKIDPLEGICSRCDTRTHLTLSLCDLVMSHFD